MNKELKFFTEVYVINENTGYIVRHAIVNTSEPLIEKVKRYATKDSIVIASTVNIGYCVYIKDKLYKFEVTNNEELIGFLKDVLCGLYDNARDSFHIEYGRVATLCQPINDEDIKCEELLNCINNIWETRYYTRFIKEVQ